MARYIVRFRGKGPAPADHVARLCALPHAKMIDSSPRMLLLEAPESELKSLVASLPEWVMTPEEFVPLPDPRPRVEKGPTRK